MALFPMFTDIRGRICVVFGGGNVAARKIRTLTKYGAHILVAAETICEEIGDMVPEEDRFPAKIDEKLVEALVEKAFLVIAATSDRKINHYIADYCQSRNIPVNVADAPEECTFGFPAVVVADEISIGIHSGSSAPTVSKTLRRKIEKEIPAWTGELASGLGQLREELKERGVSQQKRRQIIQEVTRESFGKNRILTNQEISAIIALHIE